MLVIVRTLTEAKIRRESESPAVVKIGGERKRRIVGLTALGRR